VRQTEKNTQQQQILQQFNKKALLREKKYVYFQIFTYGNIQKPMGKKY
jgi:hypothetical protein